LLDLQCSRSDAPIVTPYRSSTHHHCQKYTGHDAALPRERVRSSARLRRWPGRWRRSLDHPLRKFTCDTPFLRLGAGHPHPCLSARAGRARSREGPSGAQRCLDALYRDGAEPRQTLALTWPDLASVRGRPTDRPPHNGVQGTGRPSSQHVVLRTASCSVP
jgi:hypothetical protein